MCGIAGYVGPAEIPDERTKRALELLAHRGPDNGSAERFRTPDGRHVALLHRRLNIIDLDHRADQPLRAGPLSIVFNGELYNYLEVRERLAGAGVGFQTSSDTEVLAQALATEGTAALDRCEGMWAFATYDERDGALSLCRDRFGEKPLYVHRDDDGGLYFASEVKGITALLGHCLPINVEHLYRYIVNGYKALHKGSDTFYEGLTQLGAGELLRVDRHGERLSRYWEPSFEIGDQLTYEESVAGARERMIRAVEIRLRADVPLAFCMSGGVDSLSLISIAKNVFDYDVHGFTIVNSDERYEEQEMVDYAVAELGVRHTPIELQSEGFLDGLRRLVAQHDQPVATITYYVHWLLMESIAAHGYRISVSGSAADEIFSGYYDHHLAYLREVGTESELAQRSLAAWREHVEPVVRNPFLKNPDYFREDSSRREHIFLDAEAFSAALHQGFDEPFAETAYSDDLLRNRMLNELFHESVPVILAEDDLNAMSYSIENRSPFLDRSLFEFTLQIPTRWLIRDGMAKAVLRDSMRGIVPERVLENRRKVGFNAPVDALLAADDPEVRDYLLDDGPIFDHVKRDRIEELLGAGELPNSRSKFLFNFINAKMFLEQFGG